VGTAADSQEAYRTVAELKPDIVMLDISMPPGESGVITAGKIHTDFPDVKIIMLTMHADKEYLLYTVQIGVSGYLLKNVPEEELIEAVHTVYAGSDYISKEMVPYLVEGFVNRHEEGKGGYLSLRERELEILSLIARGYGNKEIGEKLFISVKTVESYRAKIMNKLGLRTRAELVEYALKKKLLQ
jgi:two-component system response regulator NreC